MFIRLLLSLLIGLCSVTPASASAADRGDLVDATGRQAVAALGAPGATWAVIRDGTVVQTGAAGKEGTGTPFSDRTPVVLGSLSKPLVATVAVELDRRGVVDLDEPVARWLPQLEQRLHAGAGITARQLLAHTSGLPFGGTLLDVNDPGRRPGMVLDSLGSVQLISAPGAEYRYSSLGYVVLAAWLEATTRRPLSDLLPAELPLPDAGYTATAAAAATVGRRDLWFPPQRPPFDGAGLAYGYSIGSARTLLALAQETLDDPQRLAAMTAVRPAPGQTLAGPGWRVTQDVDSPGAQRVWHTGMAPGSFTAVHLIPSERLAVVFVTNRSGFLDQQRLYDASARLLAAARGTQTAEVGAPSTILAALVGAIGSAVAAGFLLSRRRSRGVMTLGALLAVVIATAPAWLARSQRMRYDAGLLWAPTLTVTCVLAAVLAVAVGVWLGRRQTDGAPDR